MQRSRPLAVILIVLTFLGTSGSWHLDRDDPDFLGPVVGHNHAAHHAAFRAPAVREVASHCAICHWLQMFRASSVRHARVQLPASAQRARAITAVPPLRAADLVDLPSRAPPA
jgi:hypothetical protein